MDPSMCIPSAAQSADLRAIQEVVSRYVGQLLHGCNSPQCTEVLCRTGMWNTATRPVRAFTPRSARAIALTMARQPSPRAHLCRYRTDSSNAAHAQEGPRDPLSNVQQLCDTSIVRQLCTSGAEVPGLHKATPYSSCVPAGHQADAARLTAYLDVLEASAQEAELTTADLEQIAELLRLLAPTGLLVSADPSVLASCNQLVGKGLATPDDTMESHGPELRSEILEILESLDNEPSCALLCRIAQVFEFRSPAPGIHVPWDRRPMFLLCAILEEQAPDYETAAKELSYFCIWLKKLIYSHWDSTPYLSPLQVSLVKMLTRLGSDKKMRIKRRQVPTEISAFADLLSPTQLAQSWMDGDHHDHSRDHHLLSYPDLWPSRTVITCFRTINHLKMQRAHSNATAAVNLRSRAPAIVTGIVSTGRLKWLESHYLLLNVSRDRVLEDAFDQLWQRRQTELLRPLRVRLGEIEGMEVGHDLGGVQIEFFNLVCRELFSPTSPLFETNPKTGTSYFRPMSLQPLCMYELTGLLFSLAIYNGIALPVNFPVAFYFALYDELFDNPKILGEHWPEMSRSLCAIAAEDIQGLDQVFQLETNGLRLEVLPQPSHLLENGTRTLYVLEATPLAAAGNLTSTTSPNNNRNPPIAPVSSKSVIEAISDTWPGWHLYHTRTKPRETESKRQDAFIRSYTRFLTVDSVAPQWDAFRRGFFRCLDSRTVKSLFKVGPLRELMEGTRELDLFQLDTDAEYDGYDPDSPYIRAFWAIVAGWEPAKQRRLIKFVTAAERFPAAGARSLTFRIARANPVSLDSLPTSSTCFGTLMLPLYETAEVLEEKLSLAIEYGGEGFGTG